jgi:hypothetical protein
MGGAVEVVAAEAEESSEQTLITVSSYRLQNCASNHEYSRCFTNPVIVMQ